MLGPELALTQALLLSACTIKREKLKEGESL